MAIKQGFPPPNFNFTDRNGQLTPPWRQFMISLFNRTGGATGGDGYFAYVSGNAAQVFNVATALTATEAAPLAQVQGLANTAQSNAEAYADAKFAPLISPALTGTPSAPTATAGTNTTQIATTAYSYSASLTAQANAEAYADGKFAPLISPALTGIPTAPTATPGTNTTQLATTAFSLDSASTAQTNAETYADNHIRSLSGNAISSVTMTASPMTLTAASNGAYAVSGGTITSISMTRGTTTVPTGAIDGIFPVRTNDQLTITYTGTPIISWIPN